MNTPQTPTAEPLAQLTCSATSCVCKKCECRMVGYPGDDECSDCAFPALARASEAATRAVEDRHFKQTGERKTAGELLRRAIGIEESPNVCGSGDGEHKTL